MEYKTFTSSNNWFTLKLPPQWEEYDDGEEVTYAFFNESSWSGNFRITSLRWTRENPTNEDKAAKFIEEEMASNNGATKIKIGKYTCAHYKKDIEQDNEELVIYYWATGITDNLFICSFTINKDQENTERNGEELQTVQKIIESLEIK